MTEKREVKNQSDIELPPEIIESFARFLVPEIRKFYQSEKGQQEFAEWQRKENQPK